MLERFRNINHAWLAFIVISVGYAIISSISDNKANKEFWNSLEKVSPSDTIRIGVSRIIFPPGGRLSAVSAPIQSLEGKRFHFRAETNKDYDPSRSIMRVAIEPGDSIHFPIKVDTLLLKKQNGEMLYYRIIYPNP